MASSVTHLPARQQAAPPRLDDASPPPACLNCGAALAGPYCATCGQRAVDLAAPTWDVVRDAVAEATDVDGRVLRTARALLRPGLLTAEFLRGRRAPYVGPLKLFVVAGTALSTTWVLTRGVDAAFYGFAPDTSAGAYIETFVRGLLASSLAFALTGWALALGRRRLLDEAVLALHVVSALALLAVVAIWLGTGLKLLWGAGAARAPSLFYVLFLPAAAVGGLYVAAALRRVHGGAWWAALLRAVVAGAAGLAAVTAAAVLAGRGA
jgi:hypothetical protein